MAFLSPVGQANLILSQLLSQKDANCKKKNGLNFLNHDSDEHIAV